MRCSWKKCFRILLVILTINVIIFIIHYEQLVDLKMKHEKNLIRESIDHSSMCPMPVYDPWDPSVRRSIRIKPIYKCPRTERNLFDVVNFTRLVFNQKVNETFYSGSISHCVYLKVGRNPEEKDFRDWSYSLSEPIFIENRRTEEIIDSDFVLTRCYKNANSSCHQRCHENKTRLVYEYVHPIIRRRVKNVRPSSAPSVMIFILDAVSHLQASRALPRTLDYLKSRGLFTFQRHSVVGDGTFQNLVPMLFGLNSSDLENLNLNDSRYQFFINETIIEPKTKKKIVKEKIVFYPGPYDDYPFIVKNFSKLNYTTYFSEEWRESAFYNLKNGFRQSPTDFYLRPYWLSLYETLSYPQFAGNSNPKPCYLNKLLHLLSLEWLEQFIRVHHSDNAQPTFGIMKLNEMSHDYLERLFWIDEDLHKFFSNLFENHFLDNTILIFCGDHGHRQHQIRLTRVGSSEVKLPFFSVLIPKHWKEKYPRLIENMESNRNRLTSWWDVHQTLVNILRMAEENDVSHPLKVRWNSTHSGISLFHQIPDRDCPSAGVPDKFCPCSRAKPIENTSGIVRYLTSYTVNFINDVLLKNHSHLCHELNLKQIIRAEWEARSSLNESDVYVVLFEVSPSDGIFESRLLHHAPTNRTSIQGEILRVNLYGESSKCIQDRYSLRSFCYCFTAKNSTSSTMKTSQSPVR